MPQIGIPAIAAIISAVAGSAGAGVGIYEATHQPKPTLRPNPQQVAQQKAQLASIARQSGPNTDEATSGGVSPNYKANIAADQSGQQGNISQLQDIFAQMAGGGGGNNPFAALVNAGSGSPFSGGGTSSVFPSLDVNRAPTSGPGLGQLIDPSIFGERA
jgi:hypothetical protein